MVRREMFTKGFFRTELKGCCEDWDLWLQLLEHGLFASGTREPLVRYRQWAGNKSKRKLLAFSEGVSLLEERRQKSRQPRLRPIYQEALGLARARLELARAKTYLETDPGRIAPALWRAWRFYPRNVKWLLWMALIQWPRWLGGSPLNQTIRKKIQKKF